MLGCGGAAQQYHLRALRRMRGARVVAVADPDRAARERAARMVRAEPFDSSVPALEHPGVEAVVVCAPNALHADLAVAALGAGLHVYVEKPVALTSADANRVAAAADRAARVAAVGLSHRFDSVYHRARTLLHDGVIGDLREVSTTFREPIPPGGLPAWKRTRATGGGALVDLGTHQLDALRWLVGDPLATIDSAELRSSRYEHDDVLVSGRLASGATFEAGFGYAAAPSCAWVFAGTGGWLAVDRRRGRLHLARGEGPPRARRFDRVRGQVRRMPVIGRDRTFARSLAAWVSAARGDATEIPTIGDATAALEDIERIEAATAVPAGVA